MVYSHLTNNDVTYELSVRHLYRPLPVCIRYHDWVIGYREVSNPGKYIEIVALGEKEHLFPRKNKKEKHPELLALLRKNMISFEQFLTVASPAMARISVSIYS